MNRSSFLRNIVGAFVAVTIGRLIEPVVAMQANVTGKGILWQIEHSGNVYCYTKGEYLKGIDFKLHIEDYMMWGGSDGIKKLTDAITKGK